MSEALVKSEHFIAKPNSLAEAMELAKIFASSSMVPRNFQGKPADTFVAMQYGARLGIDPLAALQNIAVINGKPSIYGDALLAIIAGRSDCEDIVEIQSGDVAECTVKRRGRTPVVRAFSADDAKKAKLWGKSGPWTDYPKRMLQMRARAWALRDAYPDALFGVATIEEQSDIPPRVVKMSVAKESLKERVKNAVVDIAEEKDPDPVRGIATDFEKALVAEITSSLQNSKTEEELAEVRAEFKAAFANLSDDAQVVVRLAGEQARERILKDQE